MHHYKFSVLSRATPSCISCSRISKLNKCRRNDKMDSPPRQNKIHRGHSFYHIKNSISLCIWVGNTPPKITPITKTHFIDTNFGINHSMELFIKLVYQENILQNRWCFSTLQRICQDTTDLKLLSTINFFHIHLARQWGMPNFLLNFWRTSFPLKTRFLKF